MGRGRIGRIRALLALGLPLVALLGACADSGGANGNDADVVGDRMQADMELAPDGDGDVGDETARDPGTADETGGADPSGDPSGDLPGELPGDPGPNDLTGDIGEAGDVVPAVDATEIGDPGEVGDPDAPGDTTVTGDTDAVDEVALALVVSGKERLSLGESLAAMDAFGRALERTPGLVDAQWGLVLARFQSSVSMFGSIPGLLNLKEDPDAPEVPPVATLRAWAPHPGTVGITIDGMHAAALEQKARLDALKALPDNPVFHLEGGLPLAMGDDALMALCCSWDRSELFALSAFNDLTLAFVAFLGSQDTDVPFERLERLFKDLGLTNALTRVLAENPGFLTLLPEGGSDAWLSMKGWLAASVEDTLTSATLMEQGSDLADNVATLTAAGRPHLVLHGTFPSGVRELEVLWDGTSVSLKDTLTRVKAHLAGDRAQRLRLDADVVVALGVLVDIVNRTVGIATVAESLGFTLPDMVTGLIDSLDPEDPEQLAGLAGSLLSLVGIPAGSVELDLLTFLETPFDIRDFFPNDGPVPDSTYRDFLKSFECVKGGATLTAGDGADTLVLTAHDPSAIATPAPLSVSTYASADGTGDAFDTEAATLVPMAGFTGIYTATLSVKSGTAAGPAGDGVLVLPAGGSLWTTYVSAVHPESSAVIGGNAVDGYAAYAYAAPCADKTTAWDGSHFGEIEFAGAVEVTSAGVETAVLAVPADGKAARQGVMAFRSPSMDGLLWLAEDDVLALADQASFGTWITRILSALESF